MTARCQRGSVGPSVTVSCGGTLSCGGRAARRRRDVAPRGGGCRRAGTRGGVARRGRPGIRGRPRLCGGSAFALLDDPVDTGEDTGADLHEGGVVLALGLLVDLGASLVEGGLDALAVLGGVVAGAGRGVAQELVGLVGEGRELLVELHLLGLGLEVAQHRAQLVGGGHGGPLSCGIGRGVEHHGPSGSTAEGPPGVPRAHHFRGGSGDTLRHPDRGDPAHNRPPPTRPICHTAVLPPRSVATRAAGFATPGPQGAPP